MRRLARWGFGVACIVAAWGIASVTPNDVAWRGGFPVSGTIGAEIHDSNISVTVHGVTVAREVVSDDFSALAVSGTFVVVDLSVQPRFDERLSLRSSALTINGKEYLQSTRWGTADFAVTTNLITPARGSLIFEIPEQFSDQQAVLRLSSSYDTTSLDSFIEVPVDLRAVEHAPSTTRVRVALEEQ